MKIRRRENKRMMTARVAILLGILVPALAPALTGSIAYEASCGGELRPFLEKTMKYGRIASASPAFKQCIQDLFVGTPSIADRFIPECNPTPENGQSQQAQIQALLERTASAQPLTMACTTTPSGSGENASAQFFGPDIKAERFTWAGWLNGVYNASPPQADPWWPLSQAASIAWHEVMHNGLPRIWWTPEIG